MLLSAAPMPLAIAVAILASAGAAIAAEPPQWRIGYGMGTTEARVANEQGATFEVYCPSGSSDKDPGIFFAASTPPHAVAATEVYDAAIDVDGTQIAWRFAFISGKEFQFAAFDKAMRGKLKALIDSLRRGATLAVEIAAAGVAESFTLDGSSKALDGILDGCAG
jgi:hypothetical protein